MPLLYPSPKPPEKSGVYEVESDTEECTVSYMSRVGSALLLTPTGHPSCTAELLVSDDGLADRVGLLEHQITRTVTSTGNKRCVCERIPNSKR